MAGNVLPESINCNFNRKRWKVKRTSKQWQDEYVSRGALWVSDGNPKRPHALLTSGLHSDGFFDSRPVIADSKLLVDAASDLVTHFAEAGGTVYGPGAVDGVVGPQTGGAKLAEFIARDLSAHSRPACFSVSTAKSNQDGVKQMVLSSEDKAIVQGQITLFCDDVFSTGLSVGLAIEAVLEAGGAVASFILVLVNRSGHKDYKGRRIISLIDRHMNTWDPCIEQCPLCAAGSNAIRPKEEGGANWELLTKHY